MNDQVRPRAVNPWLYRPVPRPDAAFRLFVFPCAGGSPVTYRPWCERFDSDVEVIPIRLPGRDTRFNEPPFTELAPLVEGLYGGLCSLLELPFAFVGHSMGTLVAFELARWLRRRGVAGPSSLLVMAHRAPDLPLQCVPICSLPEEEFWQALRRAGGTPDQVFESPQLRKLVAPTIRADLRVCELYRYRAEPALDLPITALAGLRDQTVPLAEIALWERHTSSSFTLQSFDGNHFFPFTDSEAVLSTVQRAIRVR